MPFNWSTLKMVVIPRLSINTRPGAWGPDGQTFKPSRWFEQDGSIEEAPGSSTPIPQASLSGWNHLETFSEGAHMCIGYRLAVLEFKALLAALIRAFVFDEVPGVRIKNRNFGAMLGPIITSGVPGEMEARLKTHYLPVKVSLVDQPGKKQ